MIAADSGSANVGASSRDARNMELMQTLDNAWDGLGLETFGRWHKDDVVVRAAVEYVRQLQSAPPR